MQCLGPRHTVMGMDRNEPDFTFKGKWVRADLLKGDHLKRAMQQMKPDLVIHTVAQVDVDSCERHPKKAEKINLGLTQKLLGTMPPGAKIVYISTDQVFNGRKSFFRESDAPQPVNIYGKTKLAAEEAIRRSARPHLILRTNFFGWSAGRKNNFGEWLLRSLREQKTICLFEDFYFTPIYAGTLAQVISTLLKRGAEGTFHIAGRDRTSKYSFGETLSKIANTPFSCVQKAKLGDANLRAPRPPDLSLGSTLVARKFGLRPVSLRESLIKFMSEEKNAKFLKHGI